jgi:hypothetical protein
VFGAATIVLVGLLACAARARGGERGRSIEFSGSGSGAVITNLHQLTGKKDALRELEEDLYKPLQAFSYKSSLEGVVAPPTRLPAPSAIQSKRVKELLERRKNWVFMTPEDLLGAPTVEDILKAPEFGPAGEQKNDVSAFQRYYQRLAPQRAARNKNAGQANEDDLFSPRKKPSAADTASQDDSDLPSGVRQSVEALTKVFEANTPSDPFGRDTMTEAFGDPFAAASKAPSKEELQAHQRVMDQYHMLLDPSWHPPALADAVNPPLVPAEVTPTPANPTMGLGSASSLAAHRGPEAQLDIVAPMLGPEGLPDVNAQALGQTRPPAPVTQPERPKVVAPTFTVPRRAF